MRFVAATALASVAACSCLLSVSPSEDAPPLAPPTEAAIPDTGAPEAAEAVCPDGLAGPALVKVEGFCVDRTEVTVAQYAEFVAADAGASVACTFPSALLPNHDWPPSSEQLELPVTGIDWCNARAFCAWAGKRLCGAVGGGPSTFSGALDATKDEWTRACTGGGSREYPYGTTVDPERCHTPHAVVGGGPVPVGSKPACEGGFAGLLDLSGNVWEWEDACDGSGAASDACRLRGGGFRSQLENVGCFASPDFDVRRDLRRPDVGFRCCADAREAK